MGSLKLCTHGKCNRFLTIVEEYSKCTWVYLISDKTQVPSLIQNFIHLIQTQFHTTVKTVRSDNGTEFLNTELQNFFKSSGIIHQTSCPYTPQQNGVVERKHQHILNVARSLMIQASLPKMFWGDCILTAVHLINLLPVSQLAFKSPYEMIFKKTPDYDYLKVFGCLCYIANVSGPSDKFDSRGLRCVFFGYPYGQKGYRVMHLETKKCYVSRDVIFVENTYPFSSITTTSDLMFPIESSIHLDSPLQFLVEPVSKSPNDAPNSSSNLNDESDDSPFSFLFLYK